MADAKKLLLAAAAACLLGAAGAGAAPCGNDAAGFPVWLEGFRREAQRQGIDAATIRSALDGVSYDPKAIRLDRDQRAFKLSLREFMARRAPPSYVARAKRVMAANAALLGAIERRFGVQPEVLVAIWGMETGFGRSAGRMNAIRSLATLAYDCRRSAFFEEELYAALRIVQRGDKTPAQMRGAWAGELGQTQFLAKNYLKYGVDFDGDGRVDLIASEADALASTANFLQARGWRPGAGYGEGQPNFRVFGEWNRATVYQQVLALFAARIAD